MIFNIWYESAQLLTAEYNSSDYFAKYLEYNVMVCFECFYEFFFP